MNGNPFDEMKWFDAKNPEHLKAYVHLQKHGMWPEGWPLGPLPHLWTIYLLNKLADAYLESQGISR